MVSGVADHQPRAGVSDARHPAGRLAGAQRPEPQRQPGCRQQPGAPGTWGWGGREAGGTALLERRQALETKTEMPISFNEWSWAKQVPEWAFLGFRHLWRRKCLSPYALMAMYPTPPRGASAWRSVVRSSGQKPFPSVFLKCPHFPLVLEGKEWP